MLQPLQAAANAKAAGIGVYTVALGKPEGQVSFGFGVYVNHIPVPPDPPTMHAIAAATGGKTFTARSAGSASHIYQSLGSKSVARTRIARSARGLQPALRCSCSGRSVRACSTESRLP